MANKIVTLQNTDKTEGRLPRTCLKALFDDDGNYLDPELTADDINALKGGALPSLNSYLGGMLVVEKVDSSSFNVGASTTYSSSVDVSKTGYTALGVVGNTVSTGAMVVLELIVGVDTITFSVWNRTSSAISSAKLGLYILYLKNMS